MIREAAQTGIFRSQSDSGFQEGYYPRVGEFGELEALFERAGLHVSDVVSLKSIMNGLGPLISSLGEDVRREVEEAADALSRDPAVVSTCGHIMIVAERISG